MWEGAEVGRDQYREAIQGLKERSRHYPEYMVRVHETQWPGLTTWMTEKVVAVWRSRTFCCQVYATNGGTGVIRLSFNRTETELVGNVCQWKQGISWDDLQRLKREVGFGERQAVEIYPADEHVVNVANMRHLWVLPQELPFAWGSTLPAPVEPQRLSNKD